MSEFSELIKSLSKIREYMREFTIYGFKTRNEFRYKSTRTYDNERRRIESWLSEYIRFSYSSTGKRVFLSLSTVNVPINPLYTAWKSKTFTKRDITLHFFLLSELSDGNKRKVEELSELVSQKSGFVFDSQTVRLKLVEYVSLGILQTEKRGRSSYYWISQNQFSELPYSGQLLSAIQFFQGVSPFGFLGSSILDNQKAENQIFRFQHSSMVHTLEDEILLDILTAIEKKESICVENISHRSSRRTLLYGVPLKILTSNKSGRRYVCIYLLSKRRFISIRLDSIHGVLHGEAISFFDELQEKLQKNLRNCWAVSFGDKGRRGYLFLKLHIDEQSEEYLISRILQEGKAGELLRVAPNVFLYSIKVHDPNEMLPWVKTFTGHILSLECEDLAVKNKFYKDIDALYQMYTEEAEE